MVSTTAIPSSSGMARSISTTSGRSRCAKWTASRPLAASPTTSNPESRSKKARSPRRTGVAGQLFHTGAPVVLSHALLATSGTLRRYGIRNTDPGFLPWRIAEMCEQLTIEWRLWRAAAPGSPDRAYLERDIVRDSGVLGHFVADSSNPLHDTINYNGWIARNPNGYANDCQIHARFETDFVTHAITTNDIVAKMTTPELRADYFETAIGFIRQSNMLVESVYRVDKNGGFDIFRKPPSPEGKTFTAERLAAGASLLRDLWWSAWRNSANPPKRRDAE